MLKVSGVRRMRDMSLRTVDAPPGGIFATCCEGFRCSSAKLALALMNNLHILRKLSQKSERFKMTSGKMTFAESSTPKY